MTTRKAPFRGRGTALRVKVVRLPNADGLPLPAYQSTGSAGMDLVAAVPESKPLRLKSGQRALIPTGLMMELPAGFEAQVRPRSGLALRHGITVLNSPGTIDSDYRGEVQVILVNLGDKAFDIVRGERIAQLVVAPVQQLQLAETKAVTATVRGAGGFGSTGTGASPRSKRGAPKGLSPVGTRASSPRSRARPQGSSKR